MANNSTLVVEESSLERWESGSELREHLLCAADRPLLFRGSLRDAWPSARAWSPAGLCELLGARETTLKVCPRRDSAEHRRRFREGETVFETRCLLVPATFLDFAEWLRCAAADHSEPSLKKRRLETAARGNVETSPPNPLFAYPASQYWIYADYKYMVHLCEGRPDLLGAVDWGPFGFEGRGGADSTLWVGSEEAHTPCHYDTYGCNLVAQIRGRKRWTLFPPSDSAHLYPTRVPYEESSVFSEVNVARPDLERHRDFASASSHQVVLEAGDVLFVPRKWWHYVECLEDSVSVNTWISQPSDARERVKEAVVRATVAGWLPAEDALSHGSSDTSDPQSPPNLWINPNEEIFPHERNLELLSMTLAECQATPTGKPRPLVSHRDWVNVVTSEGVVEAIATTLLEKLPSLRPSSQ